MAKKKKVVSGGKIMSGLFRIIHEILQGLAKLASKYPKTTAVIICMSVFMCCLKYIPGFGDMAAQVIALVLVLAAFGIFKSKKKKR